MSTSDQKKLSVSTGWFENGPWRSKTVLAALVVCAVGLWFWYSGIRNSTPNETGNEPGAASELAAADPADPASGTPSKWSKPLPVYVKMSASYVAGYCVGWLFRKLIRVILLVSALAIALVAYGKFVGLDLDEAQDQVKRGSKWAKHEVKAAKDYFKQMLPSATAGGVGIFLGFLRRNRAAGTKPTE